VPLDGAFWGAAALAIAVTACCSLPVFLMGGLAVQIRSEFGLRIGMIGVFSAVFFGASALLSSAAGRITERIGAPVAMRAASAVGAAALAGIALAPRVSAIIVLLAVGGCASALAQVGSNLYLATRTDATRQGFAFGIKQAAIPAATLLAGLAVPLVALTVGWRWAFAGAAALSLSIAALVPGGRRAARRARLGPRPHARVSTLMLLAAGAGCGAAAAGALGTFLVDSSVGAGVAPGVAGLVAACGSAAGLATRVAVGWFADRATGGRLLWVAAMLVGGSVGYAAMATGPTTLLLPVTVLCFAAGWGWPGLFNFSIVVRNRSAPAAATGITQTGVYLGGFWGPLLFGQVAQRASYATAWAGGAGVALVGAAAIVAGRRRLLRETTGVAAETWPGTDPEASWGAR
jgi:Major Facilitator Superfamily